MLSQYLSSQGEANFEALYLSMATATFLFCLKLSASCASPMHVAWEKLLQGVSYLLLAAAASLLTQAKEHLSRSVDADVFCMYLLT